MARVDFHSHILPGIDDGSANKQQSYEMLQEEARYKTKIVVATPHFYPGQSSIAAFIKTRQLAHEQLKQYIQKNNEMTLPTIRLGAEVLLGTETAYLDDLRALAIEKTNYILIEMPYDNWDEWVYESIERIYSVQKLIPVIAHVERYIPMQKDTNQIYRLMSMPKVLGQMNTRSLLDRKRHNLCYRLIKNHMVHVLGSDAHKERHLIEGEKAYQKLIKKLGQSTIGQLEEQAGNVLNDEGISKQSPMPFNKWILNYYR